MTLPGKMGRAWCLLMLAALWPLLAQAQQSPPLGNGFKVGDGRLHTSFDLEARYDSAAGYFPPPDNVERTYVTDKLSGEALLHVRPGVWLEVPGSKVAVDFKGDVDYVHYTGLLTRDSTATSHIEGLGDLKLTFSPDSPVSVEVGDHFQRSDRTTSVALGAGVLSLFNELRLGVPLRPGGGAITVTPQIAWGMEFFKPLGGLFPAGCTDPVCDPKAVNQFQYNNLRASVQGRWAFLPKTAVVVDGDFNYRTYPYGGTPDALLLHAMGGLAGLLTQKIALTLKAGWGQDFGSTSHGALLAQADVTYMMTQTLTLKGGYVRTLEPVANLQLFRDDRGFLEAQMLLGGRLTLRGTTSLDFLAFEEGRRDTVYQLSLGPQYQFQRWLVVGAGYLLGLRSSTTPGAGINYTRHEGYVRMTVAY